MLKKIRSVLLLIVVATATTAIHAMQRVATLTLPTHRLLAQSRLLQSASATLRVPIRHQHQTTRSLIARLPRPARPSSRLVYISTEATKLQETITSIESRIAEAERFKLNPPLIQSLKSQLEIYHEALAQLKKPSYRYY